MKDTSHLVKHATEHFTLMGTFMQFCIEAQEKSDVHIHAAYLCVYMHIYHIHTCTCTHMLFFKDYLLSIFYPVSVILWDGFFIV